VLDLGGLGGMVSLSLALACLRAAKSDNMPCFLLDCSAGKMLMQLQRKLHRENSNSTLEVIIMSVPAKPELVDPMGIKTPCKITMQRLQDQEF